MTGSSSGSRRGGKLLGKVVRLIREGKSFLVTTHSNADGDALGSALALAAGLAKLKKRVRIYNEDPVPFFLKFLPGSEKVMLHLPPGERFDAALIVDCSDLDRVGDDFVKHPGIRKKIVLDHHAEGGRGGDINLVMPEAASSGVVVYRLLQRLKVPVTKKIATHIYCTLVADTGGFRYSNTNASVLKLAHDLVRMGAQPWEVSRNLFETFPPERLKLLARVLGTLEFSHNGQVASIVISEGMLRETGATREMADEFINFPRSIASVEVAVQYREIPGGYKLSFRSKDRVDVGKLASRFGGGGHERAAGCEMEGTLAEIKEKIDGVIAEALGVVTTPLYKPRTAC